MRSALLLPVLLVGLCSRRGDGTTPAATTSGAPTGTTTASVSVTKSPTTVKPTTSAPTSTRPTDSPKPGTLSTVSASAAVLTTSANNLGTTSPGTSTGMPPGTPSAAGPTSKPSPPISTTVGSNIPAAASPTTKATLSTGSGTPGSTVSTSPSLPPKTTVSSAAHESKSTTPGGPSTTSVVETTKSSSKAPSTLTSKPPLATEVMTATMAKSLGPHDTSTEVSPDTTPHVLSTGPKATARATSASSTHHAPPHPVDTGTRPAQSQIICEKEAPDTSQVVILTLNESRTCESLKNSPLEEQFLNTICQAKMPSFNRSRDQCIMRVASSTTDPKQLPIIDVTVCINSAASQLFESLTMNKGDLEKLGVVNITHNGRTEDINMEDRFSMPLIITIVCMAASLLLVAAIYGCCHQRLSQRKDQQRLTEELQTMENGYHDNPTLEVMETSSEMQEKKVNLNGELGDSWIVPMDNLTREDLEDEEDTHL